MRAFETWPRRNIFRMLKLQTRSEAGMCLLPFLGHFWATDPRPHCLWAEVHLLWLAHCLMVSWISVRGRMTRAMISWFQPSHCASQCIMAFWASVLVSKGGLHQHTLCVQLLVYLLLSLLYWLLNLLVILGLSGPKSGALKDTKFLLTWYKWAALEEKQIFGHQ